MGKIMIKNIKNNIEVDAAKLALRLYTLTTEIKLVKKQLKEVTAAANTAGQIEAALEKEAAKPPTTPPVKPSTDT